MWSGAQGKAQREKIALTDALSSTEFIGYEPAQKKEVDLARADVIVSAGRGVGKKENVAVIASLAQASAEIWSEPAGGRRGWVEHSRQIGTTGQIVSHNCMWRAEFQGPFNMWPG